MLKHKRTGKILSVDGKNYPEFNAYYEVGITIQVNGEDTEIREENKFDYPIKINNYEDIKYKGKEFISFDGLDLQNIDLSECDLSGITIRRTILNNASFKDAILVSTYFSESDLSGANFSGANLSGADFEGATYNDETIGLTALHTKEMKKATIEAQKCECK